MRNRVAEFGVATGMMPASVVQHTLGLEHRLTVTKIQKRVKMINRSQYEKGEK